MTDTTISPTPCPPNIQAHTEPSRIHFTGAGRRTIKVSNPHPCPVTVTDISVDAAGYTLERADACEKPLLPGEHCTFTVVTSKLRYALHAQVHVTSEAGTGHARH